MIGDEKSVRNEIMTDGQTLDNQIQTALIEALQVPANLVTPQLAFGDIPQWDSMGHMEVMLLLEERFGVEINNETIAGLTSIDAIRTHIIETGLKPA
jgi:acyl carrier protein